MALLYKPPAECRLGVLRYKRQQHRIAVADACRDCFNAGLRIEHLERLLDHARRDRQFQDGRIVVNRQLLKAAERAVDGFGASLLPQDDDDGIEWPGG